MVLNYPVCLGIFLGENSQFSSPLSTSPSITNHMILLSIIFHILITPKKTFPFLCQGHCIAKETEQTLSIVIPQNLLIGMKTSVCAANVRRVGLSDEWVCSSRKSKIKENHLALVKAVLQTQLVGQLISLCATCLTIKYVGVYL